jgi:hypothetical protein
MILVETPSFQLQCRSLAFLDGCQSGRLGTPGKRVYRKVPRVRIPPHPPGLKVLGNKRPAKHPQAARSIDCVGEAWASRWSPGVPGDTPGRYVAKIEKLRRVLIDVSL